MAGRVSNKGKYRVEGKQFSLKGPIKRPAPGTLPLRGDLAHVALADQYLVAHYADPEIRKVGSGGATLRLAPNEEGEVVAELEAGTVFEALDYSGEWVWGALGPEGPSGYLACDQLEP